MPRFKPRPEPKTGPETQATVTKPTPGSSPAAEWPEVLTLAEVAAYLRVPEAEVLRLVGPRGLPGRMIGAEWRFSRAAVQDWLRAPSVPSSRESLHALAGAWKDDPHAEAMLQDIYQRRGRPMTEDDA